MFNIKEFVAYLPEILIYIVSGFLFIKVFYFINYKNTDTNITYILVSSISIGFIIKYSFDLINIKKYLNVQLYYLILCAISVVMSFIVSFIYNSQMYANILKWFKVNRTINKDIWDDIIDKKYPTFVKMQMKSDKNYYYGQVKLVEENNKNPYIVLFEYQCFNSEGVLLADYSNDGTYQILLDTKEAISIELIYNDESDLAKV